MNRVILVAGLLVSLASTQVLAKSCAEFAELLRRNEAATDMQIKPDSTPEETCEGRRLDIAIVKGLNRYPYSWFAKCHIVKFDAGTYRISFGPGTASHAAAVYKDLCSHRR